MCLTNSLFKSALQLCFTNPLYKSALLMCFTNLLYKPVLPIAFTGRLSVGVFQELSDSAARAQKHSSPWGNITGESVYYILPECEYCRSCMCMLHSCAVETQNERKRKRTSRSLIRPHNNNNKHAHASQLNSCTHVRALLILHDRGILGPVN